ncbi:MAG: Ig-like domain-containing protein [Gemmatimonadaceae bacterium]|nr:Ig-like domain-containing protein [Gemmatimonadaceae bacterium]
MKNRLLLLALVALAACRSEDTVDPGQSATTVSLSVSAEFVVVGDSVQFTARVVDGNGQTVTGASLQWSSSNPAIATVSNTGWVKGVAPGEAAITARSGSATASALFIVDPNPCAAPTAYAVGEVRRLRGSAAFGCTTLTAPAAQQDFLYVVGNAKPVQDDTLNFTFSLSSTSASARPLASSYGLRDPRAILAMQAMQRVDDVENRLRAYERAVTSDALPSTQGRRRSLGGAGSAMSVQAAAAVAAPGDTVTIRVPNLNTGKNICRDFITVRAVVRTVSARATIMEDLASPPGKLSTTDYNEIAQEFDQVIFPADTLWFGAPTDLNNDQRVGILYTPEVNKLTPAGSGGIVGGFFFGGDLIRRNEYPATNDCRNQTNEQEIFYLLAPDPNATINGNARTTAGVRQVTRGTIAHEFQHMINQSVRQYNPEVKAFEVAWLNEALSHFAEEVVGRRVSGFGDFQSLRTSDVNPSASQQNDYLAFYRQNLTRFRFWLLHPDTASPTSARTRTELAQRGAAWALVRYAADHYSSGNARAFFRNLAKGPEVDIANLTLRAGRTFDEVIGGWLVANYTDNLAIPGLNPRYTYASWDMRDVQSGVNNGVYPLLVTSFPGTFTSTSFSGSGNYYLHRRAAGSPAVTLNLKTPGGGTVTNSGARIWVVRLN